MMREIQSQNAFFRRSLFAMISSRFAAQHLFQQPPVCAQRQINSGDFLTSLQLSAL